MAATPTIVFDLDGTLVDTAPDLIGALNYVLEREGMPAVPLATARTMIGAGARKLIERGLEQDGRDASVADIDRLTADFIGYYADHIADASLPFEGLEAASRYAPTSWNGCRSGYWTGSASARALPRSAAPTPSVSPSPIR
jgi:phosphoglycolate phosphatase